MNKSTTEATSKTPLAETPDREPCCQGIDSRTRHQLIARAAYFRAEDRGFAPGHEEEDWHAAEVEIDTVLNRGNRLYAAP